METGHLINTLQKAVAPQASSVAVSNSSVIADKVNSQPVTGQVLPEGVQERQAFVPKEIEEKVQDLNSFVQNIQRRVQFTVQEDTGHSIITVTDNESGEVIRTFPSEEMLAIAEHLAEILALPDEASRGLLVNESV